MGRKRAAKTSHKHAEIFLQNPDFCVTFSPSMRTFLRLVFALVIYAEALLSFTPVAAAAAGSVVAWTGSGEYPVPAGLTNVIAVSLGQGHDLALTAEGKSLPGTPINMARALFRRDFNRSKPSPPEPITVLLSERMGQLWVGATILIARFLFLLD